MAAVGLCLRCVRFLFPPVITGTFISATNREPTDKGHYVPLPEQLRESCVRIFGNGIGKGLHIDVTIMEPRLRPAQMILPEAPKRSRDGCVYRKEF